VLNLEIESALFGPMVIIFQFILESNCVIIENYPSVGSKSVKDFLGEELFKGGDAALEGQEDTALEGFLFRRRIWKELQD
jgi:hypothetical protein